jgi:L-lactate dehydrogenase (cytochrome)/(S)-mandelate dehydrogenase
VQKSNRSMMKIDDALNVADVRRLTRCRLPKVIFETIESGVEDEIAVARNASAYQGKLFSPRYLVDVSSIDVRSGVFGKSYSAPFGLAPTGFAGVFRKNGDTMMAEAAAGADLPMILSGASIERLEDVSIAAPAHLWSHLYPAKTKSVTDDLIRRAEACGRDVLVLTVDNPVYPNRERDTRNRFGKPIASQKISTLLEAMLHPFWCAEFLMRGGFPIMRNWEDYAGENASGPEVAAYFRSQSPSILTWRDLQDIRARWSGKLVLKGIQHPEDATICKESGVDGVILSNHGGKAHDRLPAPIDTLVDVKHAVGPNYTVMIDGGIRRGADIVVAGCLGASFTFIGRPALYGVAAAGRQGVQKVIGILIREIELTMALIGCPSFAELGPQFLLQS